MQYQLFVQDQPGNGYVAAVLGIPDCVAQGRTKEEAIAKAKAALAERLAQGEIVTIDIESAHAERTGNPWLDNFGRFKDDPTFDDFLAEIEVYRRELDADFGHVPGSIFEDWTK